MEAQKFELMKQIFPVEQIILLEKIVEKCMEKTEHLVTRVGPCSCDETARIDRLDLRLTQAEFHSLNKLYGNLCLPF